MYTMTSHDGRCSLRVESTSDRRHAVGRFTSPVYTYTITFDGVDLHTDDDLSGPAIGESTEETMCATLAAFVAAWAEARAYEARNGKGASDNADLFPDACAPVCGYADEFSMMAEDIERD